MTRVWPALLEVLHPLDRPPPATWPMCYETKFALARLLRPRRLLEIGVRTGYSALAFLLAVPEASFLGIDANRETHGGFRGAIGHARRVLEPFHAEVREQTSADYAETVSPVAHAARFDLIHIDGDHSLSGCSFDLRLARRIGGRHLLVDDYDAIPDVRDACDQFSHEFADEYTRIAVDDGHHGAVLFTKSDACHDE